MRDVLIFKKNCSFFSFTGHFGVSRKAANTKWNLQLVHSNICVFQAQCSNMEGNWKDTVLIDFPVAWISLFIYSAISECRSPQPQSSQVFCTSWECEGSRVDRGRAGVSEKAATKDHWVSVRLIAKFLLAQVIVINDTDVCFFRSPLVKNIQSSLGQSPALSALQVWILTLDSFMNTLPSKVWGH